MDVNINVQLNQGNVENSPTDKLAKILNGMYNGETENERLYHGVYAIPYTLYVGRPQDFNGRSVDAYYDQMIDGQPHVYSWRWWGKQASVLLDKMKAEGVF